MQIKKQYSNGNKIYSYSSRRKYTIFKDVNKWKLSTVLLAFNLYNGYNCGLEEMSLSYSESYHIVLIYNNGSNSVENYVQVDSTQYFYLQVCLSNITCKQKNIYQHLLYWVVVSCSYVHSEGFILIDFFIASVHYSFIQRFHSDWCLNYISSLLCYSNGFILIDGWLYHISPSFYYTKDFLLIED